MKEFIEKLISRLEEYEDSHLIEHDSEESLHCQKNEDDWCNCRNCLICVWDKAKAIVKELAEEYKGGWIPVTERLPGNKTNVLICNGEFVHYALFEYGHFSNDYGLWYKSVTHWQPLPEPYKSGKSEKAEWKEAVMNHFTKIE